MRLIACSSCHTQYDVSNVFEKEIACRCGERIENRELEAVEAQVHRCGSCAAQVAADAVSCGYCGSQLTRDVGKLSLICPECYGRNAEDSRFCTACGVGFHPETVPIEGVELPCPCCGCLMPICQVGGLGINECPQCNGIWVPGEKFDLLVDRSIEARKDLGAAGAASSAPRVKGDNPYTQRVEYRKCPECESFMTRKNFRKTSGVIIDRCRDHGTWLDADELERIAGFVLSGGRPEAERFIKDMDEQSAARVSATGTGSTSSYSGSMGSFSAASFESSSADESLATTLLRVFVKVLG